MTCVPAEYVEAFDLTFLDKKIRLPASGARGYPAVVIAPRSGFTASPAEALRYIRGRLRDREPGSGRVLEALAACAMLESAAAAAEDPRVQAFKAPAGRLSNPLKKFLASGTAGGLSGGWREEAAAVIRELERLPEVQVRFEYPEQPFGAAEEGGLEKALAEKTAEFLGEAGISVHPLGGGRWRGLIWVEREQWTPIVPEFDAPKFLCRAPSGRTVFWKYEGVEPAPGFQASLAEHRFRRLGELAGLSWSPAPLGMHRGFVAVPWITGQRLCARDIDYPLLNLLANYLAATCRPAPPEAEARARFETARELAVRAAGEFLEEAEARRVERFVRRVEPPLNLPACSDGRMAPHEWIRNEAGNILKLDAAGHDEHPAGPGPQCLLWDAAGLLAEWGMPGSAQHQLQGQLASAGFHFTRGTLDLYILAYLGWKMRLSAEMLPRLDAEEAARHRAALERHRGQFEKAAASAGA